MNDEQNANRIVTSGFSCKASEWLYLRRWRDQPTTATLFKQGSVCYCCAYFGPVNRHWGICCHPRCRHHLETVFKRFTCPSHHRESPGCHSFTEEPALAEWPEFSMEAEIALRRKERRPRPPRKR